MLKVAPYTRLPKLKPPTPSASPKQRPALPFSPATILLSRVQWKNTWGAETKRNDIHVVPKKMR